MGSGFPYPNKPRPLNASIGFGGAGTFLFGYSSADSGLAADTAGNLCLYSTICFGGGANTPLSGELGIVGSLGTGELCTGQQTATGAYWSGGVGIVGQGQVFDNGNYARGLLGIGGSPEGGAMAGAGILTCSTTYQCL